MNNVEKIKTNRIYGLDFARALAIFGMIFVNYNIIFGGKSDNTVVRVFLTTLEGKAAATFVTLAGIGITLMMRDFTIEKQRTLIKRAIFLFVFGLLYTPVWSADILHFYGVYLLIAAFTSRVSNKKLLVFIILSNIIFLLLIIIVDYETGWNFNTLVYTDFWTPIGMLRHLFYNGFHPVFPWISFIFLGMWLGRLDLRLISKRLLIVSSILIFIIQITSDYLETIGEPYIFDTQPLPPFPLFILMGSSVAIFVISVSIIITERFNSGPFRWLIETGQLSLSNYFSHIIIGVSIFEIISGLSENYSQIFVFYYSVSFFILTVTTSHFWRRKYSRGPLETIMRIFTK